MMTGTQYANVHGAPDERAYIVRDKCGSTRTERYHWPGRTWTIRAYPVRGLGRMPAPILGGAPMMPCTDCGRRRHDVHRRAGRMLCGDCYTQWAGHGLPAVPDPCAGRPDRCAFVDRIGRMIGRMPA